MNQSVVSSLILLLIFLAINILLALAYHSLINARKSLLAELAAAGKRNARLALQISQDASHLVNAYQLSVVTLRFLSAGLAAVGLAPGAAVWFVSLGMDELAAITLAEVLMLLLGAAVMLIFGSQIPSVVGSAYADRLALVFARPAHVFIRLLTPVSTLMRLISDGFIRLLGIQAQVTYVTEEEIMTLVDAGQEEGVIENEEKEMIYSIFQLGETAVREVMVPRLDMVAVPLDTPLDDVVKTVLAAGHSRIPVYQDNIDHVRGLLYAKDLLRLWERGGSETSGLADLLRPAYFVPEGKSAMALLQEMQQKRVHLAVVVDEYGGTAGLVTLEDL
ncbi:MAG: HlyC/CorC family transporter, partial [Anaerolineae bacterium]|nr:HlyC/CorC family transporter [Anaerolineae bacterium]